MDRPLLLKQEKLFGLGGALLHELGEAEQRVAVKLGPLPGQQLARVCVQASSNATGAGVAWPLMRTRRAAAGWGLALGDRGLAGSGQLILLEPHQARWLLPALPGDGLDAVDLAGVLPVGRVDGGPSTPIDHLEARQGALDRC